MKRPVDILLAFFLFSCAAFGQEAKTLPKLPDDPAISKGTLPNGVTYYLAPDKSSKDVFDICLVQKMDAGTAVEDLVDDARRRFSGVEFGPVSFDDFLGRNGILPSEEGYIDCRKGSVTYNFRRMASARGEAVLDTMLLAVFNLAQAAAVQGRPSSSQAVVLSGDFNSGVILSKMKTLCLVNPFVPGEVQMHEAERLQLIHAPVTVEGGAVARVSVQWNMVSTPSEYMATVLPVISGKLSDELILTILGRLYPAYNAAGLEVWIDVDNEDAFSSCGNESMKVTVNCLRRDAAKVRDIFVRELDRLYTYGLDAAEYAYARDANKYSWLARSKDLCPDASLAVERCRAAFLYGASLSTDAERIRFAYRDLPDSVQTRFFNTYMRGVIGQTAEKDSTIAPESKFAGREAVAAILSGFSEAVPLKAPKDKEEYVTGGVMWTFSNGVNVIYRKMDTRGMLYYEYAAKGGRQFAERSNGRAVDGVSDEEFAAWLASEGIEMNVVLNPADVRLQGRVPAGNAAYLFQALSAISSCSSNAGIFGSDTYKLLVLVGDMEQDKVKKMMRCYANALRPGSRWKAVKYTDKNTDDFLNTRRYVLYDNVFDFDVSSFNYALSCVAYHGLLDKLGAAFSDCAVSFLADQGYVGFPLSRYRVRYGVRNVSPEKFSTLRRRLDESVAGIRVDNVISSLAATGVNASQLEVYKSLAKNGYTSWAATPHFYIRAAMDRYLDNKDMLSRFASQVDAVSTDNLKEFYAAAAASNR